MSDSPIKQTGAAKTARNPIKIVPLQERLRKPDWIRVKSGSGTGYNEVKKLLREHSLVTVCEEASCPEYRRVFQQGHGHFHDLGRCVHTPLSVLRRGAR